MSRQHLHKYLYHIHLYLILLDKKTDKLICKEENIFDEARPYVDNHRSKLQSIANGVVQCYLSSSSCSGF